MARVALDTGVSACQGKARTVEMIEEIVGPVSRLMAVLTFGAVAPHVSVVLEMAAHALCCRIDVDFVNVTACAGDVGVSSRQGIPAFELVIVEGIRPFRLAVAVHTLVAEIAHVLVVFNVAVMALCACYVVKWPGLCMTVQTHRHQVAVAQWKVGKVVIEFVFDESDDIGVASAMLRMTFGAWRIGSHLG